MGNAPTIKSVRLTSYGLQLLAKIQMGATMSFTRAVIGDGYMQEGQDVADLTELINEIPSHQTGIDATSATVDLTRMVSGGDGTLTLCVRIKNGDKAFYMRELGIKAKDPDYGEIVFAYINFGDDASVMPAFDGSTYVIRNIKISFVISNSVNISANITLPAEVTQEDFDTHKTASILDHPDGSVTYAKLGNDICGKFKNIENSINQINSAIKLINSSTVSTTYLKYLLNDQISNCDDITDWDCTSYQEYQTDGYSNSSVLKLTDKSVILPAKSNGPVFFISYCTDNDDEIEIVQELLYSNGTTYARRKLLWWYTSGVTSNPKWAEWELDGAIYIQDGDV